jgi:hypothetical protein
MRAQTCNTCTRVRAYVRVVERASAVAKYAVGPASCANFLEERQREGLRLSPLTSCALQLGRPGAAR